MFQYFRKVNDEVCRTGANVVVGVVRRPVTDEEPPHLENAVTEVSGVEDIQRRVRSVYK